MSEYEFRQVFDILIDKEFISAQIASDSVKPLASTMPSENYLWNFDIGSSYVGISREDRVNLAVQTLKDAGWSWESEPYWDEYLQGVVPGEGLVMPNGEPIPELTLIAPGVDFDPIRATVSLWISSWASEVGIPVQPQLSGRNAILNAVFVASDFDLYIYGWSLGNPVYPDYYNTFWHSRNCTFYSGGRNAPCYMNVDYDDLVNEFLVTGDIERARELVYEMQILLADQRPYIPMYSTKIYDLARSNIVFPYVETLGGIEFKAGMQTDTQVLYYP